MIFSPKGILVAENFILLVLAACACVYFHFPDDLLSFSHLGWDSEYGLLAAFCPCQLVLTCEVRYFLGLYSCKKSYLLLEFKLL